MEWTAVDDACINILFTLDFRVLLKCCFCICVFWTYSSNQLLGLLSCQISATISSISVRRLPHFYVQNLYSSDRNKNKIVHSPDSSDAMQTRQNALLSSQIKNILTFEFKSI